MALTINNANAQVIPDNWTKHTVVDTINVPVARFQQLSNQIGIQEIGNSDKYKDLPKIERTVPIQGDFTSVGDSRRAYFNTGATVLETVIVATPVANEVYEFAYELTEIKLPLKKAAKKARGHFICTALSDGRTKIVWTYGFLQKNFITKMLLKRYIKRTHRFWMHDTLAEMNSIIEKKYITEKE